MVNKNGCKHVSMTMIWRCNRLWHFQSDLSNKNDFSGEHDELINKHVLKSINHDFISNRSNMWMGTLVIFNPLFGDFIEDP